MGDITPVVNSQNCTGITIKNIIVPFASEIIGGSFPGQSILVKGRVLPRNEPNRHRFTIDLCCGQLVQGDFMDDKALHFNARFDAPGFFSHSDNDIVLNSLVKNSWGSEQRIKNAFVMNEPFTIRIMVLQDYFKIILNGNFLCDFIHRLLVENIKYIHIDGCVEIETVQFDGNDLRTISSPRVQANKLGGPIGITRPDVPFNFNFPEGIDGFLPPLEVHLIFSPLMNCVQFTINFFAKDTEHLFHMRADFHPALNLVRNNTIGHQWQKEERDIPNPFIPGVTSDVRFFAGIDRMEVHHNGSRLFDFKYYRSNDKKTPSPTTCDKITVTGDLILQKFIFTTLQK